MAARFYLEEGLACCSTYLLGFRYCLLPELLIAVAAGWLRGDEMVSLSTTGSMLT